MSNEDNNVVYYTDKRNVLVESLNDLTEKAQDGRIDAIAVVALTSIGDVEILESYKNNTDRMALIGATQVLAQHIMAGGE
jgi:hypothetical protein|tara:strand:+ start:9017 stop:9256 length:240 start_codon:yes stop_codon:yes gene_type:complete